ncbi:MAG: signal peptidase II [Culicoidibacterales bacterium]
MKRWVLYLITVGVIAVDQITKYLVATYMQVGEQIVVIPEFFTITSHRNTGAAFSILEGKMDFLLLVTIFALGFFIYLIEQYRKTNTGLVIALAVMLGGAIGNFIDRLFIGEVVDFFAFQFGSYHFAIFNVADIALSLGVIVFAVLLLFTGQDEAKQVK